MKISLVLLASGVALTTLSAPVIREGSVSFAKKGTAWELGYILDGDPAVVTFDVQTNGVSIGAACIGNATGDVGRRVEPGSRKIRWKAHRSWPGRRIDDGSLSVKVTAWAVDNPPPYLVLSLDGVTPPVYYAGTNAIPQWGVDSNRFYKATKIVMKKIPAAGVRWRMGAAPGESNSSIDSVTIPHAVTLTKNYYIGIYPFTQGQAKTLSPTMSVTVTPSATFGVTDNFAGHPDSPYRPLDGLPYYQIRGSRDKGIDWPTTGTNALGVIAQLRTKTLLDTVDLPTEAEWEYACRAGSGSAYCDGGELLGRETTSSAALEVRGWYVANAGGATHEVGLKQPNAFGVYDMHGNVAEWCKDWYSTGVDYSDGSPVVDPAGAVTNGSHYRVLRGGSWGHDAASARASNRFRGGDGDASWQPYFGFRLWCPANAK